MAKPINVPDRPAGANNYDWQQVEKEASEVSVFMTASKSISKILMAERKVLASSVAQVGRGLSACQGVTTSRNQWPVSSSLKSTKAQRGKSKSALPSRQGFRHPPSSSIPAAKKASGVTDVGRLVPLDELTRLPSQSALQSRQRILASTLTAAFHSSTNHALRGGFTPKLANPASSSISTALGIHRKNF